MSGLKQFNLLKSDSSLALLSVQMLTNTFAKEIQTIFEEIDSQHHSDTVHDEYRDVRLQAVEPTLSNSSPAFPTVRPGGPTAF